MKTSIFLKVGKYGRPVVWSCLMVFSFYFLIILVKREFFEGWFEFTFSSIIMNILMFVITAVILILSVYNVTHPYISKTEDDSHDDAWAVGICFIAPVIAALLLLQHIKY